MAINNIATLQRLQDFAYLSTYTSEYLVQSLANLGQRSLLQNEGIEYKDFTFYDVLNISSDIYDTNTYIGIVKYKDDRSAIFNIVDKSDIANNKENPILKLQNITDFTDINDIYTTKTDINIDLEFNDITKYHSGSIFKFSTDSLLSLSFGLREGYLESSQNNIEIDIIEWDLSTNHIKNQLKLYYLYTDYAGNNHYCMHRLLCKDSTTYLLDTYILDSLNIELDYTRNLFERSFQWNNISEISNIICNNIDEWIDIDTIFNYDNTRYDVLSDLELHPIYQFFYSEKSYVTNTISYNTTNNTKFKYEDNTTILDSLLSLSNFNSSYLINKINNDESYLFETFITVVSSKFFNETRQVLLRRLLCKLYEKIDNGSNDLTLYIPLDYIFKLTGSSINILNVYYSNDIYTYFCNISTMSSSNINTLFDTPTTLIADTENNIEKLSAYNVIYNYNSAISNVINSEIAHYIYSLPYITALNTWAINDKDTGIYANGKDAGNPCIFIIYQYEEDSTIKTKNVLNNHIEIFQQLEWGLYINDEGDNKIKIDDNTFIEVYVPQNIGKKLINNLLNALFIILTKTDNGIVTTLWVINEKGVLDYVSSINNFDIPLSLQDMFNIKQLIKNSIIDNVDLCNIPIDQLVLKAFENNSASETPNRHYTFISNKDKYYYPQSEYKNNLNLDIRCYDNIKKEGSEAMSGYQSSYYLKSSNLSLDFTNAIYPKLSYKIYNYNQDITELTTIKYPKYKSTSRYMVGNSGGIYSIDAHENGEYAMITETTTSRYNIQTYNWEIDTANHSYEYVFNYDVPTLDTKEYFVRNTNILNRVNILSPSYIDGKIYNAYFGTTFENDDKTHLHIGTSKANINIGTETLCAYTNTYNFEKHDILDIDFPITNTQQLNTTLLTSTSSYEYSYINSYHIYSTTFVPCAYISMDDKAIINSGGRKFNNIDLNNFTYLNIINAYKYNSKMVYLLNVNKLAIEKFGISNDYAIEVNSYTLNHEDNQDLVYTYITHDGNNIKTHFVTFNSINPLIPNMISPLDFTVSLSCSTINNNGNKQAKINLNIF